MDQVATDHRLMVLLFTDLVNSTGCKVALGDAAYAAKVARPHNALFREILGSIPGAQEVSYTGDGFFAQFASVGDAVEAALRFHDALRCHRWETTPVQTRIGIHVGHAIVIEEAEPGREMSIVSHAADVCARVMSLAAGGQTLLTRHAFDDARQYVREHPPLADGSPAPALGWAAHGRYRFKGKDEDPLEIFEVGAVGWAPLTAPPDAEKARRVVDSDEEETLGWRPGSRVEIPGRPGWLTEAKLGEGGFGEVWLARHRKTGQARVFKFCFDPERLRALKRELTIFRLIRESLGDRDDIARLHDVRLDRAPFYLEGDYVESGDLPRWAEERGGMDRVPMHERLALVADICRAVAAAHSVGVIHKDIKPSNIFIRRDDSGRARPVLADFGIGVVSDPSQLERLHITAAGLTQTLAGHEASRTGTRLYAPPESMLGKPATIQHDIYALGVLLYQFVIGDLQRPLATGWERDVPDPIVRDDIAAATAGRIDDRLKSVTDLLTRLQNIPSRKQSARRRRLARRTILTAAAAVLVAAVSALLVKTNRASQVQTLTAQLQRGLDEFTASSTSLAGSDALVAKLARHHPQSAAEFRQRFTDRLGTSIERAIFRPNLTEQESADIERMLSLLQSRNTERTVRLRRELSQRLRQWTEVYALTAPFTNENPFSGAPVSSETRSLPVPPMPVPIPAPIGARARVETELHPVGSKFGIGFQDESHNAYEFRIVGSARGTPLTPIVFDPNSTNIQDRMSGWRYSHRDTASLVIDEGKPVLRLENNHRDRRTVALEKEFDPTRHRGKRWHVALRYRARNIAKYFHPHQEAVPPQFIVSGWKTVEPCHLAPCVISLKGDTEWTTVEFSYEIPTGAERIIVRMAQMATTGVFEITDLRITERDKDASDNAPATEVYRLSDRAWQPSSRLEDAWSPWCDSCDLSFMREEGESIVRLRGNPVSRAAVISHTPIDSALVRAVALRARIRVSTPPGGKDNPFYLKVDFCSLDGKTLSGISPLVQAREGWQDVKSRKATLPPGTAYLAVSFGGVKTRGTLDVASFVVDIEPVVASNEGHSHARVLIARNNQILREQEASLPLGGIESTKLSVERDGSFLRVAVDAQPPIEVFDPFPLAVAELRPVVVGGEDSRLRSLKVFTPSLPPSPHPLELGDAHFTAGRIAEARSTFEANLADTTDADTRMEARCKLGLCLLALKRTAEAERELAEVATSGLSIWSLLAGCRLWERYLEDGRTTQADAILQSLKARPDFAQAAACVTPALREAIGKRYVNLFRSSIEMGGPSEWRAAIDKLGQFFELVEPLGLSIDSRWNALWQINRFQECDRQLDRAFLDAEKSLETISEERSRTLPGAAPLFSDTYLRLAIHRETPEVALPLLAKLDSQTPGDRFALQYARGLLAANRWDEAAAKVAPLLGSPINTRGTVSQTWVQAALLEGLIVERKLGPETARQTWARAFQTLRAAAPDARPTERMDGSRREHLYFLILAGLSNELRDEDLPGLHAQTSRLYGTVGSETRAEKTMLDAVTRMLDRQALVEMWQGARGAAFARDYALGRVLFPEAYRTPVSLLVEQLLLQGSIGRARATSAEVEVFTQTSDGLLAWLRDGGGNAAHVITLAGAWNVSVMRGAIAVW